MAFPGDRKYKLSLPIIVSNILGALNFDGVYFINQDCLPDAMITLGGEFGLQQAGLDLAISTDEAGEFRLPLQVVRCELNATPANSLVEVWFRIPDVSSLVDTPVWLWWGSETEVLPADNADYGKYDVWNAITNSTGTSIPFATWTAVHFDELSTDPTPQFKDSSGNGHDFQPDGTSTRITQLPGRGQLFSGTYAYCSDAWSPGLNDFCYINTLARDTSLSYWGGDFSLTVSGSGTTTYQYGDFYSSVEQSGSDTNPLCVSSLSRDGDSITVNNNIANAVNTGNAAISFSVTNFILCPGYSDCNISLLLVLDSAPNINWLRANVSNILTPTSFFNITNSIQNAEILATVIFQDLNTDSKVRIYEQPHPQGWAINFTGARDGYLSDEYFTCSVVTPNDLVLNYYYYFGTDPNISGADGYFVESDGYTDIQIATSTENVINSTDYISASRIGTYLSVYNDYNGSVTAPTYTGAEGIVTLLQIGGVSTDEIDGVDSSVGDWVANYSVLKPRRAIIQMIHLNYKPKRYSAILSVNGLVVPAGALQVDDTIYSNP